MAVGAGYVTGQALGVTILAETNPLIHADPTIYHAEAGLVVQEVASSTGPAIVQGGAGCAPNHTLRNEDEEVIDSCIIGSPMAISPYEGKSHHILRVVEVVGGDDPGAHGVYGCVPVEGCLLEGAVEVEVHLVVVG